jgi:hypothetical protein
LKQIPLTQGQVALVDDEDFERLMMKKWCAVRIHKCWYAKNGNTYMHHVVTGLKGVDHHDGNGLNNQKANLRPATQTQQVANSRPRPGSSAFKGVSWDGKRHLWKVQIMFDGKNRTLGRFADEQQAAKAYNVEAQRCFGTFAKLNELG